MTTYRVNALGLFKHFPALQSWGAVLICCQKGKIMGADVWNRLRAGAGATKANDGADRQQNRLVLAE
jgi:hypothetical protein